MYGITFKLQFKRTFKPSATKLIYKEKKNQVTFCAGVFHLTRIPALFNESKGLYEVVNRSCFRRFEGVTMPAEPEIDYGAVEQKVAGIAAF